MASTSSPPSPRAPRLQASGSPSRLGFNPRNSANVRSRDASSRLLWSRRCGCRDAGGAESGEGVRVLLGRGDRLRSGRGPGDPVGRLARGLAPAPTHLVLGKGLAYPVEHLGQETRLWTGPGAEAPSRYASVPAPDYGLRPFSAGRFSRRSSSTKCRCAPDVAFVFSVEVEVACIGRKGAQGVRVTPAGGRPARVPSPDARLRPRVSRRRGRRVGSRPRTHRGTVRRSVPPRRCSDRVACRSS